MLFRLHAIILIVFAICLISAARLPVPIPSSTPTNAILTAPPIRIGHGTPNALAWTPDGKILAVQSNTGLWLYNTDSFNTTPRLLPDFRGNFLSFTQDGTRLISGGEVWNRDGTFRLKLPDSSVELPFALNTNDYVAYAVDKPSHAVNVFNLSTGQITSTLDLAPNKTEILGNEFQVTNIAISSDARLVAVARPSRVELWDTKTKQDFLVLGTGNSFTPLAFSPDGKTLAVVGYHGLILWSPGVGIRAQLPAITNAILTFSPDGQTLTILEGYVPSNQSLIHISTRTGKIEDELDIGSPIFFGSSTASISYSPNQKMTALKNDDSVQIWTSDFKQRIASLDGFGAARSVVFSADQRGVIYLRDKLPFIWTPVKSEQPLPGINESNWFYTDFSPDGQSAAISYYDKGRATMNIANTTLGTFRVQEDTFGGSAQFYTMFSANSKVVAMQNWGWLYLWHVNTGELYGLVQVMSDGGTATQFALSGDGNTLAALRPDNHLEIWDVIADRPRIILPQVYVFGGFNDSIYAAPLMLNSDGTVLILTTISSKVPETNDTTIINFRLNKTWTFTNTFSFQTVFMPDDKAIMLVNGVLQSVDLSTGAMTPFTIDPQATHIRAFAFSPDEKRIAYVVQVQYSDTYPFASYELRLLDITTGNIIKMTDHYRIPTPERTLNKVAFNADGTLLLWQTTDSVIYLYQVSMAGLQAF